jgi:hypothetical protein
VPLAGTGCAADVEEDVPNAMESPITAHATAAATIQVTFFISSRRVVGHRPSLPEVDAGSAGTLSSGLVGW